VAVSVVWGLIRKHEGLPMFRRPQVRRARPAPAEK